MKETQGASASERAVQGLFGGGRTWMPRVWLWVGLVLLALGAGWYARHQAQDRGLNREAVWVIQAAEQRADYYRAWLKKPKNSAIDYKDEGVIERTFGPHAALPPLMPGVVASSKPSGDAGGETLGRAQTVNAVFFGLFVLLVGWMGLEAGGAIGAVVAGAGVVTIPRLMGLATVPDFGMSALLMLTLAPYLLHRAGRSAWAAAGAVVALAGAIHASVVIGFFVWIPWLMMTLGRPGRAARWDGYAATPGVPLRLVGIVPGAVALALWTYPYVWSSFKDHFHLWMTHFLRQPADGFLFAGELWGYERLPWYGGAALLMMTLPPTWLLLALVGWRGGVFYERLMGWRGLEFLKYLPFAPQRLPDEADSRHGPGSALVEQRGQVLRLARGMLVFTLLLPMLVRSPSFGGIDLVALALPWVLVYAAAGMARLAPVLVDLIPIGRGGGVGRHALRAGLATGFALLVVMPAAVESARYHPLYEAYYSWFVGGPGGARALGVSRYARGPLPVALLDQIREQVVSSGIQGEIGVHFLLPGHSHDQVLSMLNMQHQLGSPMHLSASPAQAQAVILPHDDTDPRYGDMLGKFYETYHHDQRLGLIVYERDAVPIFSALILRTPQGEVPK